MANTPSAPARILNATQQKRIRDLINSAGGRFASVTFIKKDGSERVMVVQPAAGKFRVKGADASPSAQQAAETRAERHPHFLNVIDVQKNEFRSINLHTVHRVRVDSQTFEIA